MITFAVNGVPQAVDAARGTDTLLDYLHDDMNLTGTKFCCGIGVCRACTVAVTKPPADAASPVIACSTPLSLLDGCAITTVEGVADGPALHPIQTAFLHDFAFQCGYCTPGFVMASKIFLDGLVTTPLQPADLDSALTDAIGAHICRCTGYARYYQALRRTAEAVLAAQAGE